MHRIHDFPKNPKSAIHFGFAQYSIFDFLATINSFSSIKISIENKTFVDGYSVELSLFFSLASVSW